MVGCCLQVQVMKSILTLERMKHLASYHVQCLPKCKMTPIHHLQSSGKCLLCKHLKVDPLFFRWWIRKKFWFFNSD
jgi:hypothetical protein